MKKIILTMIILAIVGMAAFAIDYQKEASGIELPWSIRAYNVEIIVDGNDYVLKINDGKIAEIRYSTGFLFWGKPDESKVDVELRKWINALTADMSYISATIHSNGQGTVSTIGEPIYSLFNRQASQETPTVN